MEYYEYIVFNTPCFIPIIIFSAFGFLQLASLYLNSRNTNQKAPIEIGIFIFIPGSIFILFLIADQYLKSSYFGNVFIDLITFIVVISLFTVIFNWRYHLIRPDRNRVFLSGAIYLIISMCLLAMVMNPPGNYEIQIVRDTDNSYEEKVLYRAEHHIDYEGIFNVSRFNRTLLAGFIDSQVIREYHDRVQDSKINLVPEEIALYYRGIVELDQSMEIYIDPNNIRSSYLTIVTNDNVTYSEPFWNHDIYIRNGSETIRFSTEKRDRSYAISFTNTTLIIMKLHFKYDLAPYEWKGTETRIIQFLIFNEKNELVFCSVHRYWTVSEDFP